MANDNPFFYESASELSPDLIKHYYTEGGNITKVLFSHSNCYVQGERGAGKSMALRFHSHSVQKNNFQKNEFVGVYIPCSHPIMQKIEPSLYSEILMKPISEHIFILPTLYHLVNSLSECDVLPSIPEQEEMLEQYSYMLSLDTPIVFYHNIFHSISLFALRETNVVQQKMNSLHTENPTHLYTFYSLIIPLLDVLRSHELFSSTHFSFMFDDAHMLPPLTRSILNSYVSYRDHSKFSFKVAIASGEDYDFSTINKSILLQGHDYALIDMQEDFQATKSDFGKFVRKILKKRLELIDVFVDPDEYFPESESLKREIAVAEEMVRKEAIGKYGESETKKINDHVYKYGRAKYFRDRPGKASLPQYSGLNTLSHVSTGVIRNLLYPCWLMYENENRDNVRIVNKIRPQTQAEILKDESDRLWARIKEGYSNRISGCSSQDSKMIDNLMQGLGDLLRQRLKDESCSEPRILSFIVSQKKSHDYDEVIRILNICRKAQLLFIRYGPSKDDGKRENYYTPNRLLWITRGLDPEGQHGRLSLTASDLYGAMNGKPFTYNKQQGCIGTLFERK